MVGGVCSCLTPAKDVGAHVVHVWPKPRITVTHDLPEKLLSAHPNGCVSLEISLLPLTDVDHRITPLKQPPISLPSHEVRRSRQLRERLPRQSHLNPSLRGRASLETWKTTPWDTMRPSTLHLLPRDHPKITVLGVSSKAVAQHPVAGEGLFLPGKWLRRWCATVPARSRSKSVCRRRQEQIAAARRTPKLDPRANTKSKAVILVLARYAAPLPSHVIGASYYRCLEQRERNP